MTPEFVSGLMGGDAVFFLDDDDTLSGEAVGVFERGRETYDSGADDEEVGLAVGHKTCPVEHFIIGMEAHGRCDSGHSREGRRGVGCLVCASRNAHRAGNFPHGLKPAFRKRSTARLKPCPFKICSRFQAGMAGVNDAGSGDRRSRLFGVPSVRRLAGRGAYGGVRR